MAIDPLNPKPLKRVIRRNPKTKATDAPRDVETWSMNPRAKKAAAPAVESWWLKPENLQREKFQAEARQRHPNKLGIALQPYP